MDAIIELLAQELNQPARYVENVVSLLDEGNTIPFIARYVKNSTGPWTTPFCGPWRNG